jgi:hypothetical protein
MPASRPGRDKFRPALRGPKTEEKRASSPDKVPEMLGAGVTSSEGGCRRRKAKARQVEGIVTAWMALSRLLW